MKHGTEVYFELDIILSKPKILVEMKRYYQHTTHYVTSRNFIFHFVQDSQKRIFFLIRIERSNKAITVELFHRIIKII